MKKMNSKSFVFKVWKTRKLNKAFAKEEEEEIQEDVPRDSKDVKDCNRLSLKCKLRTCFYRLFMSGQENH